MDKRQVAGILIIAVSIILFFVLFFSIKNIENSKNIEVLAGKN